MLVLGTAYRVVGDTEFEGPDKRAVAPFGVEAADWVRVKARQRSNGELRAREVRRVPPRTEFEVEGELTAFDLATGVVGVGPLQFALAPGARARSLQDVAEGGDARDPLALFLADEQKGVPFSIALGEHVLLGGSVSAGAESRDEYDLRRARSGDRTTVDVEAKVDLLWSFDGARLVRAARGQGGSRTSL